MAKKKVDPKYVYSDRRQRLFSKYLIKGMRILDQAEQILLEDYSKYQKENDFEGLELILSELVSFQLMVGRNRKAEGYLREREAKFPKSLAAKLAIARYLGDTRQDYRGALRKLREIRLPAKPGEVDCDTYYNALNFKGIALLHLKQFERAEEVMTELADFTEKNLSRILFFFDLHFVDFMIERRLALPECKRYLRTLRQRKQVSHDQKKTVTLLHRVNRLARG